jgi:hypothetical protein
MNAHYTNRAKQAIAEADRFIAKEQVRSPNLRDAKTQDLLDFYVRRRDEMVALLVSA